MRFIAIARLISPVPPEQLPSIMERFADWREQYRDHLQSFEFFAGSPGGFMLINAPDEAVLNQLMAEYPFVDYVDIEVRPIIDGDTALAQWWPGDATNGGRLGTSTKPSGASTAWSSSGCSPTSIVGAGFRELTRKRQLSFREDIL